MVSISAVSIPKTSVYSITVALKYRAMSLLNALMDWLSISCVSLPTRSSSWVIGPDGGVDSCRDSRQMVTA